MKLIIYFFIKYIIFINIMINKILITNNNFDIHNYMYNYLVSKYDKKLINNFTYFEHNNNKYIKVKSSNIHIEFSPYCSAIDKIIITELIFSFCNSLNNLFYKEKVNKTIIIYNFYLLNYYNQLSIYYLYNKFKNYCNFILISNSIDNIIYPIINNFIIEKIKIDYFIDKKWDNIYKYHLIEKKKNWINIVDKIFENILIKHSNLNFIKKNRNYISLLFISNIDIKEIFDYLYLLCINNFKNSNIYKIYLITEIFTKYKYTINKSTRYIIHFEALLIQIYKYIHYL